MNNYDDFAIGSDEDSSAEAASTNEVKRRRVVRRVRRPKSAASGSASAADSTDLPDAHQAVPRAIPVRQGPSSHTKRSPPRKLSPRAALAAQQKSGAERRAAPPPSIPERQATGPQYTVQRTNPPRRLSPRASLAASTRALSPSSEQRVPAVPQRVRRSPQVPSDSQLESKVYYDADGNEITALLTPENGEFGKTKWVLTQSAPNSPRIVVGAPPVHLSQRGEEYCSSKRLAIQEDAQRRQEMEKSVRSERSYPFPSHYTFSPNERKGEDRSPWATYCYDDMKWCHRLLEEEKSADRHLDVLENLVHTLQPIQIVNGSSACECIECQDVDEASLQSVFSDNQFSQHCERYLNLQPLPLANAEVPELTEAMVLDTPRGSELITTGGSLKKSEDRGLATLGGIWCTVDGIREDGRPCTARDVKPPRRVMRICGGQPIGTGMRNERGQQFDVRCFELLLFPQESISPSAVNYGAEGITLGHMVPPPVSSIPLTPRLIDDQVKLREYRKRQLTVKDSQSIFLNNMDDALTFRIPEDAAASDSDVGKSFLTQTIVSVSTRQKYTVDVVLVMLPYVELSVSEGRHLVEVPRFNPSTVVKNRRLQGVSLSFSTKAAFLAAYKSLLWATECNITDVMFLNTGSPKDMGYARVRMSATISPLAAWRASLDSSPIDAAKGRGAYQKKCLDFTALNILKTTDSKEPLRLKDFVIDGERGSQKSTIFTNTLDAGQEEDVTFEDKNATVVSYIPFGVIRRAVSQKTNDVFDVRVVPRNRVSLVPLSTQNDSSLSTDEKRRTKTQLDRDVEASIFMEYASRFSFSALVHAVIIDEQRYYIFQEPWASALAMEKQHRMSPGRVPSMNHNEQLKRMADHTVVMTLKDFINAVFYKEKSAPGHNHRILPFDSLEARLQITQLLCSELLLLLTSIHGKGMVLGPCPPQRILVKVDTTGNEGESRQGRIVTPRHIQLVIPDLGISSRSWNYERQQCGVLEYLSPFFIMEVMKQNDFSVQTSTWSANDDWWTFLCLCFEMFSHDGSALLVPEASNGTVPTPLLSRFKSPDEVLLRWKQILPNGIRAYVHQRVLSSVSPIIDSWISSKAEELELFGTTGPRKHHGKAPPRGCPPMTDENGRYIGVSLSSMYLKGSEPRADSPSQPGEPPAAHAENILADMPFVFFYRELFDSILDIVLSRQRGCGVHKPSMYLLTQPFFRNLNMVDVFDGSYELPKASQQFFFQRLTKAKAEEAVVNYRTRAFRDPLTRRPEAPFLLQGGQPTSSYGGPQPILFAAGQGDSAPRSSRDGLVDTPARHSDPQAAERRSNGLYTAEESAEITRSELQVRNTLYRRVTKDPAALRDNTNRQEAQHAVARQEQLHAVDDAEHRPQSRGPQSRGPQPCGPQSYQTYRTTGDVDRMFQQVEFQLNHMGAPSQTSTTMNTVRNSIWPHGFVDSSIQRSRAASTFAGSSVNDNSHIVRASEPRE